MGETENEWQKAEQVPILLLKGARSFFDAKNRKHFFANLDLRDNPIYPISNPDGQDFAIMGYGHFSTRNGLKLRKLSTWH